MQYRVAQMEDLKKLIELKNEVKQRVVEENLPIWQNGYPYDSMIKEDVESQYGRIVEDFGIIVAYAAFYPAIADYPTHTFQKDDVYSFGRVMVRNGYEGKHYASYLVSHMIEEAKILKSSGMGILVDSFNEKALRLYKHYGFCKEGSASFEYADLDIYGLYFD